MEETTERTSFLSLRSSDSGVTLINTDALVRKNEQQERQIERKNKLIGDLEDRIVELEEVAQTYKVKLDRALKLNKQSVTSWTRNLVEENAKLKERIESMLEDNEELKGQCIALTDALAAAKERGILEKTQPFKAEGGESKESGDTHKNACRKENIDTVEKARHQRERVEDAMEEVSALFNDNGNELAGELCVSDEHAKEQQVYDEKMYESVDDENGKLEWKSSSIKCLVEDNQDLKKTELRSLAIENESGKLEFKSSSMQSLLAENEDLKSKLRSLAIENESGKLEFKSSSMQSLLAENEDLKSKLRSLAIENESGKLEFKSSSMQSLLAENEDLKSKLRSLAIENESGKLEFKSSSMQSLLAENEDLKSKLTSLAIENESGNLEFKSSSIQSLLAENEDLKSKLMSLAIENESGNLEFKSSSMQSLLAENEDLKSKLTSLAIENENGNLEFKSSSIQSLLAENEDLKSKLRSLTIENESGNLEFKSSSMQSLLSENEDLKSKLRSLAIENEELTKEYAIVSEGIRCKAYNVLVLEDLVKELIDYIKELEDCINGLHYHSIPEGGCSSSETILTGKLIPREEFEKLSKRRAFLEEQQRKIFTRDDVIAEVDSGKIGKYSKHGNFEDKGPNVDLRKGVIEKEDKGKVILSNEDEENVEDDTLSEGTVTDEDTFTEEDFINQGDAISKVHIVLDENSCSKKESGYQEASNIGEDGTVKEDRNGKEDEIAEEERFAKAGCTVHEDVTPKEFSNTREGDDTMNEDLIDKKEAEIAEEDRVAKADFTVYGDVTAMEYSNSREEDGYNGTLSEQFLDAAIRESESESNHVKYQTASTIFREVDTKYIDEASRGGSESNRISSREELVSVLEKLWISLGESDQSIASEFIDGRARFDRDPIGAVSLAIFKLREENRDLRREQSEMNELVEFLNLEAKFTKEELEDTKKLTKNLEKENEMMKIKCAEFQKVCQRLVSKYKKISAIYLNLEARFRVIVGRLKDLEVKCLRTEEEFAKTEDKNKLLEDEKAQFEMKTGEMVDARTTVGHWGEICAKLNLLFKKDHAGMISVDSKCRNICKLAKRERYRRKTIESKYDKLLRQRKMRKRVLIGRSRIYRAFSGKTAHLQLENSRLHSENIRLVEDRKGFQARYKSEVGLNVFLTKEVDGLQSRISFFKEIMQRNADKIKKIMEEKKLAYEELERVRNVKREARRRVEELTKEREIINGKNKAKDREIERAKKQSEDIEMQLQASKNELMKITEKLSDELTTRQNLESFVEEERKVRGATEQQLREAVFELNEAKELLENAARRNEEFEELVDKLHQEKLESSKKKPGRLRRWFGRRRKSKSK